MLVLSFLVSSIGLFRLYSKTEQLEQLMGEEVTDINEILAVINNIQVILYSLQLMYCIMIYQRIVKNSQLSSQASQTLLSPKVVGQAAQQVKQGKEIRKNLALGKSVNIAPI